MPEFKFKCNSIVDTGDMKNVNLSEVLPPAEEDAPTGPGNYVTINLKKSNSNFNSFVAGAVYNVTFETV